MRFTAGTKGERRKEFGRFGGGTTVQECGGFLGGGPGGEKEETGDNAKGKAKEKDYKRRRGGRSFSSEKVA